MFAPLLATKLYSPPPRLDAITRPRLLAHLDAGLHGRLTLVSAAAGFGKTTLVSAWLAGGAQPAAWLSLDPQDNDLPRFLAYLIAALQTLAGPDGAPLAPHLGDGVLAALRAPSPPPPDALLTALVNEIAAIPSAFILVLDDYHVLESPAVDAALGFLLDHMPPAMHLVIATREDPPLPLARLRARGQLCEVRAADLRFTFEEAAAFLNQAMSLPLTPEEVAALEARTEGWISGLQLAAISLQGHPEDAAAFIRSFTGSHHFVLDYLIEEVLDQQPAAVQHFLLRTAILDRMCGPLCDALLDPAAPNDPASGETTLYALERANLFVVRLDDARCWYRYHHLFGDLLRQRLRQIAGAGEVAAIHSRASAWFEANNLELEAFQHAVAAQEIDRAARLAEGRGMPLLFRGAVAPVIGWLAALPRAELDARPALWVMYASALLFTSRIAGIEEKLRAAEAVLQQAGLQKSEAQEAELDAQTRSLIGHIASIRATVALTQHQADVILAQAHRALEFLPPDNLPIRAAATWTLGYAHQLRGDRLAARQAYTAALAVSEPIGHFIVTLMATQGIGHAEETDNRLQSAAAIYHRVLKLAGDPPLPVACQAHLGLARIHYAWDELAAAATHAQESLRLGQQIEYTDRAVASQLFLARLHLAQGDAEHAAALLAQAEQAARQHAFALQFPEIAAVRVLLLLRQGDIAAAAEVAQRHDLPVSQARVHLAQGDGAAALARLEPSRQMATDRGWLDMQLQVLVLAALAHQANRDPGAAQHALAAALALAAPGRIIRPFVDEGAAMARLLATIAPDFLPEYVGRLLAAFDSTPAASTAATTPPLAEPLSARELEILNLIAQGLSNQEIGARLFLALDTVKGYNRRIFEKLQVQRRTEAVAKAQELRLLPLNRLA